MKTWTKQTLGKALSLTYDKTSMDDRISTMEEVERRIIPQQAGRVQIGKVVLPMKKQVPKDNIIGNQTNFRSRVRPDFFTFYAR